ncbi:serine hydrolase [Hyunsoonleella flava]|uniref:Serine hydrolase n=1 Tax=Hyunsoonleella flava TaxID=2527939 RepID=A0A4Q9FFP8_9FLAO|nr:serine hydrolase [Hyunsoonleella flava]TBN04856.1 serine hydrolase [Hyunsoonleella flava]
MKAIIFLIFNLSIWVNIIAQNNDLYFPPVNSDNWETVNIDDTQWNGKALQPLLEYIKNKGTKAFIILKDGKIVTEWYGDNVTKNTNLPWYSAGKTLVAFTAGIAQQEGFLNINTPSNDYLGSGWSSLTKRQEDSITVKHHLTMTTGLDFEVFNKNCTLSRCLHYKNKAGSFWFYHNAAYTKIQAIISGAVNQSFISYFNKKLQDRIGMTGEWKGIGYAKPYYSNARTMARFGLLNLNKGIWQDTPILQDTMFFQEMTNTSQTLNKSYGYLWWLNGKKSFRLPGLTREFKGKLIPNAPDDLIAGLGKNDQKLYIVPSQNLVIVRLGDRAKKRRFGPSNFDNELWEKINALIN